LFSPIWFGTRIKPSEVVVAGTADRSNPVVEVPLKRKNRPVFPSVRSSISSLEESKVPVVWTEMFRVEGEEQGSSLGKLVAVNEDGTTCVAVKGGTSASSESLQVYRVDASTGFTLVAEMNLIGIQDVDVNDDGSIVAIGLKEGLVRIFRLEESDWQLLGNIQAAGNEATWSTTIDVSISISADGQTVGMGSLDDMGQAWFQVVQYDTLTSQWKRLGSAIQVNDNSYSFVSVELSSNSLVLAVSHSFMEDVFLSGAVQVFAYDQSDWTQIGQAVPHLESDVFVSLSRDGYIMAISHAGTPRVYRYDSATDLWDDDQLPYFSTQVSISGSGTRLALVSDRQVTVCEPSDQGWEVTGSFDVYSESRIAFAKDGTKIVVGSHTFDGSAGSATGRLTLVEALVDDGG
jgi:hypothetical protein